MLHKSNFIRSLAVFLLLFVFTGNVSAHCDSVEGPVVKAAKKSLETGNLNYVLVWVSEKDEAEIKGMFDKVLKVRELNEDARELADMYFYETVVRVHRMGEGVGYTGLKFEDFKPEEGIEAADMAIEKNSVQEILSHIDESNHKKVQEYFAELQSKRNFNVDNVKAGREYVSSYVHFIHYVEGLFTGENGHEGHTEHKHTF